MGLLSGLSPLLTGTLLATCLIARGEAFIARPPSFSKAPPLLHVQQQHEMMHSCSLSCGGSSGSEHQPRLHTAVLPVTMLLASSSRPLCARRTHSSSSSSSSSTALFANGGDDPMGPGTQQLSRQAKLAISVLIDLIGMSSYAIPGVGETTDLGWAPISSAMIFYLYGNSIFAGLAFVEEILPGFDIIPTATIAWFLTNSDIGQNVTNAAAGNKTERPPSSSSVPDARGAAAGSSRKVDGDLSGVIDVGSED